MVHRQPRVVQTTVLTNFPLILLVCQSGLIVGDLEKTSIFEDFIDKLKKIYKPTNKEFQELQEEAAKKSVLVD